MVQLPIIKRARQYGYVFWHSTQDGEMAKLLGKRESVDVTFMNAPTAKKRIDWRYRRISVGWRSTRSLPPSTTMFVLRMSKSNRLEVSCQ